MSLLAGEIQLKTIDYRPCIVDNKKALFHQWSTVANVRDAILTYQTPGQLSDTFGIVEFEDGSIERVLPGKIQFRDTTTRDEFRQHDLFDELERNK